MKNSKLFIIFFLSILFSLTDFIFSNAAYSQKFASDTMVQWSPVILKPLDFTIIPDTANTPFVAYTTTKYFYLKRNVRKQGKVYLDVKIINNFWKTKSYMKKSYMSDSLLLRHEQGHFDISEIYARRLIKKLDSVYLLSDYSKELFKAGEENDRLMHQAQMVYDMRTNHGDNRFIQKIWNRKIEEELEELEKYSSKQVLVRLKMK